MVLDKTKHRSCYKYVVLTCVFVLKQVVFVHVCVLLSNLIPDDINMFPVHLISTSKNTDTSASRYPHDERGGPEWCFIKRTVSDRVWCDEILTMTSSHCYNIIISEQADHIVSEASQVVDAHSWGCWWSLTAHSFILLSLQISAILLC